MLELIKRYARPIRFTLRYRRALRRARTPGPADSSPADPPGFIIGCGRSGTTILGSILEQHPSICYLFEPYHLWAAVDPRTDATNLYEQVEPRMLMDASFADDAARLRFARTILRAGLDSGRAVLIEKTPHNTLRLDYIEALAPGSRHAHIVRDGVAVARSIERLASTNTYRMAHRPHYNQWWGNHGVKWSALARDGARAGYFPDEIARLTTHAQRGAYEWLVSLLEIDRHRAMLGERLCELTHAQLLAEPRATLTTLVAHFGLDAPAAWLDTSAAMLGSPRDYGSSAIELPPRMADEFNRLQERFGFAGRAVAVDTGHNERGSSGA